MSKQPKSPNDDYAWSVLAHAAIFVGAHPVTVAAAASHSTTSERIAAKVRQAINLASYYCYLVYGIQNAPFATIDTRRKYGALLDEFSSRCGLPSVGEVVVTDEAYDAVRGVMKQVSSLVDRKRLCLERHNLSGKYVENVIDYHKEMICAI